MHIVKLEGYLIKERIYLNQFFNAEEGTCFVELTEPDTFEFTRITKTFSEQDPIRSVEAFASLLPKVLFDHDFYHEGEPGQVGAKFTSKDLIDLFSKRLDVFTYLVDEYSRKVLFSRGRKSSEKSRTSPEESSAASS